MHLDAGVLRGAESHVGGDLLGMPDASGLMFDPPPELRDATVEEIVDTRLAYSPIDPL
ncbi:hypothetical protein GCM10009682_61480 [Luedemannella flava]|uniref:Uncharacterized protein n=1 Tax=Luedemannella flava TaxID=349316 RepID=A0ABN2MRJ1_9ACTN